tara:strand:+ start:4510 stop:5295 length:786 start_codon:yes stop_codon:yes gene_type:complete
MKVVILAGGFGTRISEETILKPKPLIEIGNYPIIWHIMKIFSFYGFNEFIICCGYKGYMIKDYFINYINYYNDIDINFTNNSIKINKLKKINWKIKLIDTGENTYTGGRLLRIKKYLNKDKNFFMTYGDGVSDVNISELYKFHKKHKKYATVTAVKPNGRYGILDINEKNNNSVKSFIEKPSGDKNWINGGFFVLNKKIFNYLKSDEDIWEQGPLQKLSRDEQLFSFKHKGFWKAMDTLNDKNYLNQLWKTKLAPWKMWND